MLSAAVVGPFVLKFGQREAETQNTKRETFGKNVLV